MRNKLIALVRPFDIFGLVPLMTFARAPKVYSRLSMFLSIFTLSVLLFIILYLGISVVKRQKPSFFQYQIPSTSNTEKLMFGDDTFPIKLSKNIGTLVYGQDFFFDAYAQSEWPVSVIFEFDEQTCSDDWSLECFPQTQDVGKSYIGNAGIDSFEIDLYTCATPGSGCATSSDIDTQLASGSFFFYYNDQVVDPYDFDEPIKIRPMQNSEPLQKDVYKIVIIYLEETEFITDNGWLLESLTTQRTLSVDRIQTYAADVTGDYRATLLIKYTGNKNVYKRTYPKIQDLLAQVSGIVAVMIPVVALLAFPYAQIKMKEYMVNELYEVKLNKKSDGGNGKGKNKNKTKGSGQVKDKHAANSILPEKFGTGNREQGSPQKRLVSSGPREKIIECPSPPLFESFENPKPLGNENDIIIEKPTALSRPSGLMMSPGEPQKSSFENSQAKFNALKKPGPGKSQIELISFEEGTPQKDEDGFLNKEVNELDKVEDDNCEEAIEVCGAPIFLNQARHSDKLNLTFRQFLKSYLKPQPEVEVIKKLENDLTDAMDLASLAKKSSDLDKLKAILFTPEERAIFDNLPISVVTVGVEQQVKNSKAKAKIVVNHYKWENSLRGNVEKVNEAYMKLRDVDKKTELQKRLLGFYESQYLEDYLAHAYQDGGGGKDS